MLLHDHLVMITFVITPQTRPRSVGVGAIVVVVAVGIATKHLQNHFPESAASQNVNKEIYRTVDGQ